MNRFHVGVRADAMPLWVVTGEIPQPSKMHKIVGTEGVMQLISSKGLILVGTIADFLRFVSKDCGQSFRAQHISHHRQSEGAVGGEGVVINGVHKGTGGFKRSLDTA